MTLGPAPALSVAEPVHLTVAADPSRLPLARVVATSCGALAELPMDRIDDLRQCTQESLAILLAHGCSGHLTVHFAAMPGGVEVVAMGTGADAAVPDETSFAWLLLAELAPQAVSTREGGALTVRFHIADRTADTAAAVDAVDLA